MAWSEEKRKKLWGKAANPGTILGVLLGLYGGMSYNLILIVLGLACFIAGLWYYNKYKKKH